MRSLPTYEDSYLWKRLDAHSHSPDRDRNAVDHLKSSVRHVAAQATWISTQICRHMGQYTLHQERHFLNVLSIMDSLLPTSVIDRLTPLECAFPILAAYTHDLGMALASPDHRELLNDSTSLGKRFATYRMGFSEELRHLQRWRAQLHTLSAEPPQLRANAQQRIDSIEGHILASFLRDTHTRYNPDTRLREWLRRIRDEVADDALYHYGPFNYERNLALICASHGHPAEWLRKTLNDETDRNDGFCRLLSNDEGANLAFPGLLLRLADIMDFDASRAPRILFTHFGIDNDASILEWHKHLSVIGWTLAHDTPGATTPALRYEAECIHPVHQKAILAFKRSIDDELAAVREELELQCRNVPAYAVGRYGLHLPAMTEVIIHSARDPATDRPRYVWHDLQFRLQQDQIRQLLLGESLYGDHSLCIRELIQNALDALEVRELRLKMKRQNTNVEFVDGDLAARAGFANRPAAKANSL